MKEIQLRRLLHQNPELAFEEFVTQDILRSFISELNFGEIHSVGTGLVVVRETIPDRPFFLFRAEMDALPIEEKTDYPYRSKNSLMHACGHDFHMAVLYGLMERIVEKNSRQNVICVFQPGEETGCGALRILDFLFEKQLRISCAVAMHVTDEYPAGTVASKPDVLFCASSEVDVEFVGESAHAAFYWKGKDALRAAMEFLKMTYDTDWGEDLVWFGKISGGSARNVVADKAVLLGTVRSKKIEMVDRIVQKLEQTAAKACEKCGTSFELKKGAVYRQVEVDDGLLDILRNAVRRLKMSFVECETKFTAEDFGYFSQHFPALMFWLGTRESQSYGLHNDRFLPADELIPVASDLMFELLDELSRLAS